MRASLDGVRLGATDLVVAAVPSGAAVADVLAGCWEAGAALLPLDMRLPGPAIDRLLRRARPTVLIEGQTARRRTDGLPVAVGTAALVATSGTSGEPGLVMLSRDAVAAAVAASAERLGLGAGEPWLLCIPPAHIGGLLVLARCLLLGSPLIVHDAFDAGRLAAETTARWASIVPTMLHRLVEGGADLGHMRGLLIGGDSLSTTLAGRARVLGAPLVHTYGQSQSCGGVVYDGIALPGVGVDIDHNGEVLLSGPTLMTGYRDDPDATSRALTADGRLRTGDVGELDASGRLRVLGRMGDVIVTGGEKVAPAEVEAALRSHPGVRDVAVVGEADEQWGERVVAMIVPSTAQVLPPLEELRDWVRSRLPAYAAPKALIAVTSLPVTAAGKVRREQLRALLAQARAAAASP